MTRLEVALPEEQIAALERLARKRHMSVSDLIQEGVAGVLGTAGTAAAGATAAAAGAAAAAAAAAADGERRRRALAVVGKFRSERGDLSTRHDDYFAEACDE